MMKKFLFYSPALFFLVLLVFSSSIYYVRFEKANNTTPSATDVLSNFGKSLTEFPILDIKIIKKIKVIST
jgi:hypothetical protein